MNKKLKKWRKSDGNPLLYEKDPLLVDKTGLIVLVIWLASIRKSCQEFH